MPLRIRNFRSEDLGELHRIDQTCFPRDIAYSREELLSYLSDRKGLAWVAEGGGRIVGFVLARIEGRTRAHVLTLDVIPEARRLKIGTSLMNVLHAELAKRGIDMAILEVGVNNRPAQRLYAGLGYAYLETLLGYYHGREDAYRLVRSLAMTNSKIPV